MVSTLSLLPAGIIGGRQRVIAPGLSAVNLVQIQSWPQGSLEISFLICQ